VETEAVEAETEAIGVEVEAKVVDQITASTSLVIHRWRMNSVSNEGKILKPVCRVSEKRNPGKPFFRILK